MGHWFWHSIVTSTIIVPVIVSVIVPVISKPRNADIRVWYGDGIPPQAG